MVDISPELLAKYKALEHIDPDMYARYRKVAESAWNDPEIGPKFQAKAKSLFPDAKTNEDVVGPMLAPYKNELEMTRKELKEFRDTVEAERKERADAQQKQSLQDALEGARRAYNLTEEGFDKMVARMKETGNYSDAEAAAAYVASKTPPAPVAGPSWAPQDLNLFGSKRGDEAFKQLHLDPQGYMDAQLDEFVKDRDGYVRDTFN